MQIMTGWTIDWSDVAVGVVLLCSVIVLAACARVLKIILDCDVVADECKD